MFRLRILCFIYTFVWFLASILLVNAQQSNMEVLVHAGVSLVGHPDLEIRSLTNSHLGENGHFIAKVRLGGDGVVGSDDDDASVISVSSVY